ncbi:MAG: zinc ribbon domain-containing protein [Ruminiclostridium sp.]
MKTKDILHKLSTKSGLSQGEFTYTSLEQLTDFLVERFSSDQLPPEQARAYFETMLPQLNYWKNKK